MNTNEPITGGCYCGRVRYRITGPLCESTNCYCADCRRVVGAQSVAWVTFNRDDLQWESEPTKFASSPGIERTFCPNCGSSLTYQTEKHPGHIDITTATLDNPEEFPPRKVVYGEERLTWDSLTPQQKTPKVSKGL